MKGRFFLCVAGILISGCAIQPLAPPQASDVVQNARYSHSGKCAIFGQASALTWSGDVKYAAGCEITLVPNTPYFGELAGRHLSYAAFPPMDPSMRACIRVTVGDSAGGFQFTNLPAGTYIAYTEMYWKNPSSLPGNSNGGNINFQNTRTKRTLSAIVEVKDGETKKVVLE